MNYTACVIPQLQRWVSAPIFDDRPDIFMQILQDIDACMTGDPLNRTILVLYTPPNLDLAALSLTTVDRVILQSHTRHTALATILPHCSTPSARGAGETTVITATAAIQSGHRGQQLISGVDFNPTQVPAPFVTSQRVQKLFNICFARV